MRTRVIIHSDGACSGNPGPGGWSAMIRVESSGGTERVLFRGGSPNTTNNAMELSGAEAGLAYVRTRPDLRGAEITLRSDSEYVLKGLKDWLPGWKRRGWTNAAGDPVKNRELWERLDALKSRIEEAGPLHLAHVRGHSGDPENEAADAAAVAARDLSRTRSAPWSERVVSPQPLPEGAGPGAEAAAFQEEAEARGYRRYQDPFHHRRTGYLFSMQSRVRDGSDTLYFVNVDVWDVGAVSHGTLSRLSLEATVQFNTGDGHEGEYVNVKTPFQGFEATEAFFAKMWSSMGFGRYERAEPDADAPAQP
jgi:ribonuclease HI